MKTTWHMSVGLLVCLSLLSRAFADEPAQIPKKVLKELDFMAGKWQTELTEGGEKIGMSYHERRWCPGNHCLIMTSRPVRNGVETHATGISGWNAKGKAVVEHWYVSDGLSGLVRYPLAKMKKDAWVGTHRFIDSEGNEMKGSCRLEKKGEHEWVFTADWEEDGKELSMKNFTRKVEEQAPVVEAKIRERLQRAAEIALFDMTDVTRILTQIESGDPTAAEKLLPLVYKQLRRAAQLQMAGERVDHTLQVTALVHEACLRLVGDRRISSQGSGHFYAAAAEVM